MMTGPLTPASIRGLRPEEIRFEIDFYTENAAACASADPLIAARGHYLRAQRMIVTGVSTEEVIAQLTRAAELAAQTTDTALQNDIRIAQQFLDCELRRRQRRSSLASTQAMSTLYTSVTERLKDPKLAEQDPQAVILMITRYGEAVLDYVHLTLMNQTGELGHERRRLVAMLKAVEELGHAYVGASLLAWRQEGAQIIHDRYFFMFRRIGGLMISLDQYTLIWP